MTDHRRPQVSVVMPVYNSEKYLAEAIDSILAQTFTDFELIIVDDGSQDGSAEIIKTYAERDSRIRFIQHRENRGESAARSSALAAAKGEYITGLDSDDISLPERLQKQVDFLRSNPHIGAVGVNAVAVSENLQLRFEYEMPERHAEIMLSHYVGTSGGAFVHASVLMPRQLVLEAGGYDESLRYSPDVDLMTRLLGRMRYANIPDPLYVYRRRAGQKGTHDNPKRDRDIFETRQRRFELVWGERASVETLDRLARLTRWSKLTWRERRAAKRDILRLIDSMIAADWVEADDRQQLIEVMNMKLERVSPRLWQKFCYWRRHNFGESRSEHNLA